MYTTTTPITVADSALLSPEQAAINLRIMRATRLYNGFPIETSADNYTAVADMFANKLGGATPTSLLINIVKCRDHTLAADVFMHILSLVNHCTTYRVNMDLVAKAAARYGSVQCITYVIDNYARAPPISGVLPPIDWDALEIEAAANPDPAALPKILELRPV